MERVLFVMSLFLAFFFIFLPTFHALLWHPRRRLLQRIRMLFPKEPGTIYEIPLAQRLLGPLLQRVAHWVGKLTPSRYRNVLAQLTALLVEPIDVNRLLGAKWLLFGGTALFFGSLRLVEGSLPPVCWLLPFALYFAPDVALRRKLERQRQRMQSELPYLLDMLSVVLEAGTSFDNALVKICAKRQGPLYRELERMQRDVSVGSTREEALRRTAERVRLSDFSALARALIQADRMGVSIVKTIRMQSEQLRVKRAQRIREKAMKLPVKMMFPLVFFIFPPIFLVILGPGALQIIAMFSER